MAKSSKRYFLVHIYGSTEPSIVGGAHDSYDSLLKSAREFVSGDKFTEGEDGIFYLVTQEGHWPKMGSFTGDELESIFEESSLD